MSLFVMAKRSQQDVAILAGKAARLLESGMSVAEVADELQVSARTVQRWRNRPRLLPQGRPEEKPHPHIEVVDSDDFQKNEFQEAILSYKCAGKLEALIPIALDQLESILKNPDTRTTDRLRACQLIGDWSGLNGGLEGSIRRVLSAGYLVIDPTSQPTQEKKSPGLTMRQRI